MNITKELFEKAKRMRIKICPSDPEIATCNLMIAMIKNNSIYYTNMISYILGNFTLKGLD